MIFDPDTYTMIIRKEKVDGDFLYVGRVAEFINITAYEDTYEEAREILLDAIQTLKTMADEAGAPFPAPNPVLAEEYSGRPSLRLPQSLHARAVKLADNEGVSLNTYLVTAIAMYTGESQGLSWAAKEISKNMNAAFYMVARSATKFMTSNSLHGYVSASRVAAFHPISKGTPLIEVTNNG